MDGKWEGRWEGHFAFEKCLDTPAVRTEQGSMAQLTPEAVSLTNTAYSRLAIRTNPLAQSGPTLKPPGAPASRTK